MRLSDMFQPRWLKADQLTGRTQALIVSLQDEEVNGDRKAVLRMQDLAPLILNAKQAGQLQALFGNAEMEEYAGERITLAPCEYRKNDGTTGQSIDISAAEARKPAPKPALKPKPKAPSVDLDDADDADGSDASPFRDRDL